MEPLKQPSKSLAWILAIPFICALLVMPYAASARVTPVLANRVDRVLRTDRRLNHVRCYAPGHGVVVLDGKVFDSGDRALAESKAVKVRGVRTVVNKLQTETGEWAEEQARINHALASNGLPLAVQVIGSRAYLTGDVAGDSEQVRALNVIASVSRLQVVNFSRVVPSRVF
jgi:BON domain